MNALKAMWSLYRLHRAARHIEKACVLLEAEGADAIVAIQLRVVLDYALARGKHIHADAMRKLA